MKKKYEYKVIESLEDLDVWGEEGWIFDGMTTDEEGKQVYVLHREKEPKTRYFLVSATVVDGRGREGFTLAILESDTFLNYERLMGLFERNGMDIQCVYFIKELDEMDTKIWRMHIPDENENELKN